MRFNIINPYVSTWDTTGGAKPVKIKIHVLGTMTIKPNRELNKDNNVEIEAAS